MKRFLAALTLTCALSVSAMAGDIPTCGVTSPAPGETQTPPGVTAPGEIPSVPLSVLLTILDFAF
jgi:hypothetical protein